jgi:hypothetical protein
MQLFGRPSVDSDGTTISYSERNKGVSVMTLSSTVQSLVSSDKPTVVMPPAGSGNFQGWGILIG